MIFKYLISATILFTISATVTASDNAITKRPIPDLYPTTYYIADEDKTSCVGKYRNVVYDGTERTDVLTPAGETIATVCTRFFKVLCMEGTGILKDRGQGKFTINWAGNKRFKKVKKCIC